MGCRSIAEKMNKGKKTNVKPFMVKNYLSVFINCMIENPAFDSQVSRLSNPLKLLLLTAGRQCFATTSFSRADFAELV